MRPIPTTAEQKKIETALRRLKRSRERHELCEPICFAIPHDQKTREEKTLAQFASFLNAMGVLYIVRIRDMRTGTRNFGYTLYRLKEA